MNETKIATNGLTQPPLSLLEGASLFLDFDGTLVDFASRPDAVEVTDDLRALIHRALGKLNGRVAIVSGRPVAEIDAMLGSDDMAVSGSHGLEVRSVDGTMNSPPRPAGLDQIVARMKTFAEQFSGVLVEEKPLGVALHYRLAPAAKEASDALARVLAAEHGLMVQQGKMMVEVRVGGGDKGAAIRSLMGTPAMAGTRPVFAGDDETDEAGFVAVGGMGGAGILVGAPRATAARYRLDGVAATLAWLEAACA